MARRKFRARHNNDRHEHGAGMAAMLAPSAALQNPRQGF